MDDAAIATSVCGLAEGRIWFVFTDSRHDKKSRDLAITAIRDDIVETLGESNPEINVTAVNIAFWNLARKIFRLHWNCREFVGIPDSGISCWKRECVVMVAR